MYCAKCVVKGMSRLFTDFAGFGGLGSLIMTSWTGLTLSALSVGDTCFFSSILFTSLIHLGKIFSSIARRFCWDVGRLNLLRWVRR